MTNLARVNEGRRAWGHAGRLVVGTLVAVAGAASAGAAFAEGAMPAGATPAPLRAVSVTFALEAHSRLGAMAAYAASLSKRTSVGEALDATLGTGTPASRDICMVQTTPSDPVYLKWSVHATVRSADSEQVAIDLSWTRTTAGGEKADGGEATITMRPGQSHLVDIVSAKPGDPATCSHISLRVSATRYFPVSTEMLVHRLWLVYERDGKRWTSDPVEAIGRAGESLPFRFRPLEWNLAGAMEANPSGPHVDVDVLGTVTTDLLPDGRFETLADVKRDARFGAGTLFGSGTLMMAGRLGEAGEVELPAPGGRSSVPVDGVAAGPLAPGFSRRPKWLDLNVGEFFRGSKTSLVMTVERLR
jgi:hypothetical protein